MTKQTHTVATDALATLGTIIDASAGRDAIHLAVEPVIAVEKLFPGQHVGFVEGGVGTSSKPVGIVDPFITGFVAPGQHFWLVVYPRTITSLRHVWAPRAAFIDDHIGNGILHARQLALEEAANVAESFKSDTGEYAEKRAIAAAIRSLKQGEQG